MGPRRSALTLALLAALGGGLILGGCESPGAAAGEPAASAPVEVSVTEVPGGEASTTVVSTTGSAPVVPGATGGVLLGKWHNALTGETLEFRADGTVLGTAGDRAGLTVTYTTDGDLLTIDAAGGLLTSVYYSVEGDTLTLTDPVTGEPGVLQRIE